MSKSARPSRAVWIAVLFALPVVCGQAVYGQESPAEPPAAPPAVAATYTIETGTRIPLALISSVSSKSSSPGDRIYLETAFPIVNGNHIVISATEHPAVPVPAPRPNEPQVAVELDVPGLICIDLRVGGEDTGEDSRAVRVMQVEL